LQLCGEKKEMNSMTSKLTTREKGDVTIMDISGKLTLGEGLSAFREKMCELVEARSKRVLVNMASVSRIDSCGIGQLAVAYTTITSAGGEMKLLNLDDHLHELLRITKLCDIFEIHRDEDLAIESFSGTQSPHTHIAQPSNPLIPSGVRRVGG
jgi:anti-sigma B factor antagonist